MIVYFLGIPGSGKSYFGVNVIYDNFAKDIPKKTKLSLKKDYQNCYTNINEFKFDLVNNVHNLDYDILYKNLTVLHRLYKKKATDEELIEKAKELNIYKTLFVIDECHNFFDSQDAVKVWWLTYHRHLFHDIYLITQNLALVHSKYKPLAEAFYKAKSSSLTLNKRFFNYMYYTDSRLTLSSFVETKKVLKRPEVFNLYKSGDKVESKNVILKFIYIALSLFVFLLILFYLFYYKLTSDIEPDKKSDKVVTLQHKQSVTVQDKIIPLVSHDVDDLSQRLLLIFNCSQTVCSSKNISLPPQVLKYFIDHNQIKKIYEEYINYHLTIFYLDSSTQFYIFLSQNGGSNAQNINSDISIFPTSSE